MPTDPVSTGTQQGDQIDINSIFGSTPQATGTGEPQAASAPQPASQADPLSQTADPGDEALIAQEKARQAKVRAANPIEGLGPAGGTSTIRRPKNQDLQAQDEPFKAPVDYWHSIGKGMAAAIAEGSAFTNDRLADLFEGPLRSPTGDGAIAKWFREQGSGGDSAAAWRKETEVAADAAPGSQLVKGTAQFATGMLITRGMSSGLMAGAAVNTGKVAEAIKGAITSGAFFDPHQERLSNLLDNYPSLRNPVTDYLAAKPGDSEAEGRFKNALEGLGLGAAMDGFFGGVRALKNATVAWKQSKDVSAVLKAITEEPTPAPAPKPTTVAPEAITQDLKESGIELTPGSKQAEAIAAQQTSDNALAATKGIPNVAQAADHSAEPILVNAKAPEIVPEHIKDEVVHVVKYGADTITPSNYMFNFTREGQLVTGGHRQVIQKVADWLGPEIDTMTGGAVQTHAQVQDLAKDLAAKPEEVIAWAREMAGNAEKAPAYLLAARQHQLGLAKQIFDEASKLASGEKPSDFLNQLIDSLGAFTADIKAAQKAAARTVSAGKITREPLIRGDAFTERQIRAILMSGGDPETIGNIVRQPKPLTTAAIEAYNYIYHSFILSGPDTHARNIIGNTLNWMTRAMERSVGGQWREVADETFGSLMTIQDSVRLAKNAFVMNRGLIDPKMMGKFAPGEASTGALHPSNFIINGQSIDDMTNPVMRMVAGSLKHLDFAVGLPFRFLTSADELFKQMTYRGVMYRKAMSQVRSQNMDPDTAAQFIQDYMKKSYDDLGKGIDPDGILQMERNTFTEKLPSDSMARGLQNFLNQNPLFKTVAPFIGMTYNTSKQAFSRTPAQFVMRSFWQDMTSGDAARAAEARGKIFTSALFTTAATLAATSGQLTGSGPANPEIRKKWLEVADPYTVKMGDYRVNLNGLEPFSTHFRVAADFSDLSKYMNEQDKQGVAMQMVAATAQALGQNNYTKSLADFLEAVQNPKQNAERWVRGRVASSLIPNLSNFVTREIDPIHRDAQSMLDEVRRRVPFMSQDVAAKYNILGEPIRYLDKLGPIVTDAVNPFVYNDRAKDPVMDEVVRLGKGIGVPAPAVADGRIDLRKYTNAAGEDAYSRMMALRADKSITDGQDRTLRQALTDKINDEEYRRLPEDNSGIYTSSKATELNKIFGQFQWKIVKKLREEFPSLDADMKTDQKNLQAMKSRGDFIQLHKLLGVPLPEE